MRVDRRPSRIEILSTDPKGQRDPKQAIVFSVANAAIDTFGLERMKPASPREGAAVDDALAAGAPLYPSPNNGRPLYDAVIVEAVDEKGISRPHVFIDPLNFNRHKWLNAGPLPSK